MKSKWFIFFLVTIWGLSQLVAAQPATHAPASVKNLDTGWEWAFNNAGKSTGFYVGYAVERKKDNNVCMGNHKNKGDKSLYQILHPGKSAGDRVVGIEKLVGILFRYDSRPKNRYAFKEIAVNSLNEKARLEELPVYWLGTIADNDSIAFLDTCFNRAGSDKSKEKLISAVGIHSPGPKSFGFLKKALTGNYAEKIRKSAAFWMGLQQSAEAAKVLLNTVYNDKSLDVRENAVFGLYLVERKEADDALVQLARKGKNKNLRKKAIFWLGQRAVKRTAELLGDIIDKDKDNEIRKAAVFSLSQHPKGVDKLIKLAKTHRSLSVRKQAIFWLGESEDPRALDVILGILKK